MKLFEVIVDVGDRIIKEYASAKNKKEMLDIYGGNGKFEKITDITKNFTITTDKLTDCLKNNGYSKAEVTLIIALVEQHNKEILKLNK